MTKDIYPDYQDEPEDEIEYVSKSEMKREAQRMHDLGRKLTELNPKHWPELPLSDTLLAALKENTRLSSLEAKRRHLNFIAKHLLADHKIERLFTALDLLDPSSEAYGRINKQQELWRERLVKQEGALEAFIDAYPSVDRQQLRNLIRNAQKELTAAPDKPSSSYKKLFQFIKQVSA